MAAAAVFRESVAGWAAVSALRPQMIPPTQPLTQPLSSARPHAKLHACLRASQAQRRRTLPCRADAP
eukprot:4393-Pleurochrysis_carterae.AAC.1